jgi:hypothetical protein
LVTPSLTIKISERMGNQCNRKKITR